MERRKDSRGRSLRVGEGQNKEGRYYYRYRDAAGKERRVYSWTLTAHDATPRGKHPAPCLRELERRVQRDLFMAVAPTAMMVAELVGHYVSTRANVRPTPEVEPEVDGISGFLFLDGEGRPLVAMHWQHRMKHARDAFDRTYREPLGAKVTPHVMRHTYATRLAANGVSPATIQRLLGHASYEVTASAYVNADDPGVVDADARELRRCGL